MCTRGNTNVQEDTAPDLGAIHSHGKQAAMGTLEERIAGASRQLTGRDSESQNDAREQGQLKLWKTDDGPVSI